VSAAAVEPTSRPVKPPSPREPSTTVLAFVLSSISSGIAEPEKSEVSTAMSGATVRAAASASASHNLPCASNAARTSLAFTIMFGYPVVGRK
jgi:hypothetical protein